MDKLLTKHGRIKFNGLVAVCAILLAVPLLCFNLKQPTETTKLIGNIGLCAAWFGLIGIMLYLQHSVPTVMDLRDAIETQMGEMKVSAEAWASIRIKQMTFAEMSWKDKLVEIFVICFGVGLLIYGILDYLNFFPVWRIRAADGTIITLSHWGTGTVAILGAYICFIMASFFRTKFVDKWEDRFRQLLKEVDDEFGGGKKG